MPAINKNIRCLFIGTSVGLFAVSPVVPKSVGSEPLVCATRVVVDTSKLTSIQIIVWINFIIWVN